MNTKKENRNAYGLMKFRKGVFQLRNKKSGKLYLQMSEDLEQAFNSDKFKLRTGLHPNKELQNDWAKSGSDNFEFSILDELKAEESSSGIKIKSELKEFLELHRNELIKKVFTLY
ncbi:MAG: hypothetical protein B6D44_16210 [Ignavibacteriales bacterium UTCHB2]|jgi:hypothetical protein|nr:MAG: hypothetical protein BWY38_02610 [Ignavibacteria bacterium ADurb.Bin266]OQY70261.1 MAG: hypothetical protein B6D44_16210 [Ignavibacteriales bacterium UTCHB2]HQI41940.1 GIY-YIG nuclease family protein [Ignavibacteriaceae bacterium]